MRLVVAALACALVALPRAARAEDAGAPVKLAATPIFGPDAVSNTASAWSDVVARIENTSATPQRGTVEIASTPSFGTGGKFTARAPFAVPPGRSAVVRLPLHETDPYAHAVSVTALGDKGEPLATVALPSANGVQPLLVDVEEPSRLAIEMRSYPVPVAWSPTTSFAAPSVAGAIPLVVGAPSFDRTTGDPVLPERTAGYAPVTAVLVRSDVLARLPPLELDALVNWVLGGGTLAIVPSRPEDLRGPVVTALVGGDVTRTEPPAHLFKLPAPARAPHAPGPPTLVPLPGADDEPPPTPPPAVPMGLAVPAAPPPVPRVARPSLGPTAGAQLAGYAGGNLHPSDFGASAAYGLGEVHVMAFDPAVAPMLDDPWSQGRVADMVARAWDRRALTAFPHGGGERNDYRVDEVRRALDPNENFRPGLGFAAILLVIYSIVSGPVLFLRARGRPLRPLVWAPLFSAVAFGTIVVVGLAGKGWRGRARHLALIESGAGVTRGTVRRFRGFFASETRSLSVRATDRTCVLDVATGDMGAGASAVLLLDRNGATLENLTSLPWQTVVVREDGFVDFKGGVSVASAADGGVEVTNHTGRTLEDVMVWAPTLGVVYFPEMKDGARVTSREGRVLTGAAARRSTTSGARTVHPMGARELGMAVGTNYADKYAQTWTALESAAGDAVDWWPDDVPVVAAELRGGESASSDSGLGVENDRVFLRVVGKGGAP